MSIQLKWLTKQRSLVITLLDLKNAFGKVHLNSIQPALDYHHTLDHIKLLLKSLYTDFKTCITPMNFALRLYLLAAAYFEVNASALFFLTCVLIVRFSDTSNLKNIVNLAFH